MGRLGIVCVAMVLAGCGGKEARDESDARDARDESDARGDGEEAEGNLEDLPDACLEGCEADAGGSDAADAAGYPDHTFIYQAADRTETFKDLPVVEEVGRLYRTTDELPELDVRRIVAWTGGVYAIGATTVMRYDAIGDKFVAGPGTLWSQPVVDVADTVDALYLAYATGVQKITGLSVSTVVDGLAGVRQVAVCGDMVFVLEEETGICRVDDGGCEAFGEYGSTVSQEVRDMACLDGVLYVAGGTGMAAVQELGMETLKAEDGELLDNDVRALASDGSGVLAGSKTGLTYLVPGEKPQTLPAAFHQLPNGDATSVRVRGDWWVVGHEIGVTILDRKSGKKDHYHSLRYMPQEHANDADVDKAGTRWIATAAGVGKVYLKEVLLKDKAEAMFTTLDERHWRLDGFLTPEACFADQWTLAGEPAVDDSDNDGLWTQMAVGALCMAYATTKDEKYYEAAHKAMRLLMLEIDIPAVDFEAAGLGRGFVTRSLVRDDEGGVYESKKTQSNWHKVDWTDGHGYYWKDDTSSDETTGHFFGYPLYYDLCAKTEEERAEVAEHAAALAEYIVDHGYMMPDLDGLPTTFAQWQPEKLGIAVDGLDKCLESYDLVLCMEAAYGGGFLNSLEIMGHLLAAWHMTGNPKFYDAYDKLIVEHRYDEVATFTEEVATWTQPGIANHSDHELGILAMWTLLRYEPNEARRQVWIKTVLDSYQWEVGERNPFWSMVVALGVGEGYHLAEGVQTLHEIPSDLRLWLYDNSYRTDVELDVPDRHGHPQFTETLPYDERGVEKWNSNPKSVVDGGAGQCVEAATYWLLPYWGLRYLGAVQE